MKPSTRTMLKLHGWRIDRAVHNYLYYVFYRPYVRAALYGTRFLTTYFHWCKPLAFTARFIFNRYHSKVLSWSDACRILTLNRDVDLSDETGKRVVPYDYARRILFMEPEYIAVMDCPCKSALENPCEPVNCCIAVGRRIAVFWLEHCRRYNARRITQAEALDIVGAHRRTGHVTQAFLKVATGGATGVICNCCPKCCVSLEATKRAKRIDRSLSMTAPSGYSVRRDAEKCERCGDCADVCPVGAVIINNVEPDYDPAFCLGCELCVEKCPGQALELYRDPEKCLPLDVDYLENSDL